MPKVYNGVEYAECVYKSLTMWKWNYKYEVCKYCDGFGRYFDERMGEYKRCERYIPRSGVMVVYGD